MNIFLPCLHGTGFKYSFEARYMDKMLYVSMILLFHMFIFQVNPEIFCVTAEDSVGNTICKVAKDNNASAIIIGQRGLGAIRRTLLGSVSDYVVHHSHIPTIVVPASQ